MTNNLGRQMTHTDCERNYDGSFSDAALHELARFDAADEAITLAQAPTAKDALDAWAKRVAEGKCESPVVRYEPQKLDWDEQEGQV